MSRVFKVTPKRIKRTNGQVLTPDMSVVVTTKTHATSPFTNGAQELKEAYIRLYGFDYQKAFRYGVEALTWSSSTAESCGSARTGNPSRLTNTG